MLPCTPGGPCGPALPASPSLPSLPSVPGVPWIPAARGGWHCVVCCEAVHLYKLIDGLTSIYLTMQRYILLPDVLFIAAMLYISPFSPASPPTTPLSTSISLPSAFLFLPSASSYVAPLPPSLPPPSPPLPSLPAHLLVLEVLVVQEVRPSHPVPLWHNTP